MKQKVAYNHPIDWQKLIKLKDTINVIVTTDKGALYLELYPKLASGSVANFITLIQESFLMISSFIELFLILLFRLDAQGVMVMVD